MKMCFMVDLLFGAPHDAAMILFIDRASEKKVTKPRKGQKCFGFPMSYKSPERSDLTPVLLFVEKRLSVLIQL